MTRAATKRAMSYQDHRRCLIDYLISKVALEDWHAVSDAANDLRELDAEERGRAAMAPERVEVSGPDEPFRPHVWSWLQDAHPAGCCCLPCRNKVM